MSYFKEFKAEKKWYVFPCYVSFACSTIKINPTGPSNWDQLHVCEQGGEISIDLHTETAKAAVELQ